MSDTTHGRIPGTHRYWTSKDRHWYEEGYSEPIAIKRLTWHGSGHTDAEMVAEGLADWVEDQYDAGPAPECEPWDEGVMGWLLWHTEPIEADDEDLTSWSSERVPNLAVADQHRDVMAQLRGIDRELAMACAKDDWYSARVLGQRYDRLCMEVVDEFGFDPRGMASANFTGRVA